MKTLMLRLPFLLLCAFFILQGCKEDEPQHPEVQTLQLEATSPSSVTLKGNVVARGTYNLVDYGFVYGYSSNLSETSGTRVTVGQDVPIGEYQKVITGLTASNSYYYRTVYARAFITNEKGTVFGQVTSVELPSPNISSVLPTSGKAGDKITINGSFYTSSASEVEVTFGGVVAKIVEVTPSKVVAEVPTGISYSNYYSNQQVPVQLKIAGQTYSATSSFRIIPVAKDFSPKSGTLGTVVTVTGDNLPSSSYYSYIRAYIGSVEVSVSNYSSSSFQITIPSSLTTEKAAIKVVLDGTTTILPGEFTVIPHTVTSISPLSGLAGSSFTITGNFNAYNTYYGINASVKIGDTPANISNSSSSQLTVNVPQNMMVGSHKVYVTIGPHTVEAPQQYQVLAPSISGISPASGGAGKEVTINGTFLAGQYYTVYFGSVSVSGYATTSTTLRAYVPANLTAGKVQVSVQMGTQRLYTPTDFTFVAPTLDSFSPSSGVAGSIITLNISGFTPSYYTTVKFGTVTTSVISFTESTIRVAVPSGVTGTMKISVINSGQTMVSSDNFTVN